MLGAYFIREQVRREALRRSFPPGGFDAWMHAEAAYRIASKYGPEAAFKDGVLNEWATQGRENPPDDTEHDFMNNWQGLSYGMSGDELLKRGMLFKSPSERIPGR